MHTIGDSAVRMGLDTVEAARGARRDLRHVLAHLEMVDRADIPRFAALGAVAAIQPLWAFADEYVTELTTPVLGPERTSRVYPIGSLARAGALLAAGSDWSVSSPAPLEGIQVALTRQDPGIEDDAEAAGTLLGSGEELPLARAIAAYTTGAARATFEEAASGILAPGKWADLVVLDRNPFEVLPRRIGHIRVIWTLREGRAIFGAAPLYIKR
jgi:predicted amidohydrolase YtcJ